MIDVDCSNEEKIYDKKIKDIYENKIINKKIMTDLDNKINGFPSIHIYKDEKLSEFNRERS